MDHEESGGVVGTVCFVKPSVAKPISSIKWQVLTKDELAGGREQIVEHKVSIRKIQDATSKHGGGDGGCSSMGGAAAAPTQTRPPTLQLPPTKPPPPPTAHHLTIQAYTH